MKNNENIKMDFFFINQQFCAQKQYKFELNKNLELFCKDVLCAEK